MPHTVQAPTLNEYDAETHPAFGMMRVSRHSVTPGAILFDSDIRHGHTVVVTIETATRDRDLHRDWIHGGNQLIEVEMSESQWAAFVSSMGTQGTPVTLRHTKEDGMLPDLPYDPRLAHSMDEVNTAATRTFGKIKDAMAAVDALDPKAPMKDKKATMRALKIAIAHAEGNLEFASKSLTEHAENVVQRSRADIEAMAMQAADRLGLPTGTRLLELEAASNEEETDNV